MTPIDYLIQTIENTAKLSLSQRENTFEMDGIIHCSDCGDPLQAWIKGPADANGVRRERLMPVVCRCIKEKERIAKEQQQRRDFDRLLKEMRMTVGMRDYPMGNFAMDDGKDAKKSSTCRKYVDKWDDMKKGNLGILFCGPAGTGKTFYAECIVTALAEKGVTTAIVAMSDLVWRIQADREPDEIYDTIRRFDLLVIDDIEAERNTSYGMEVAYNIVNTRYNANRPTIFTTNLSLKELQQERDRSKDRIYDRVIEMSPIVFKMNGESRRRVIAEQKKNDIRDKMEEYKKLLDD